MAGTAARGRCVPRLSLLERYAGRVNAGIARGGPFLAALTDDDARELRALGRIRDYDAGDAIFHQGDETGDVSILLAGRVKVTNITAGGKEVILAFRGPGDIVGETPVPSPTPRARARSARSSRSRPSRSARPRSAGSSPGTGTRR